MSAKLDAPNLGRLEYARQRAVSHLSDLGYSRLAALVGGKVAEVNSNWQQYASIAREIRMPNGKHPHIGSVARHVRKLRDDGVITCQRVFVNGRLPTGAKYNRSSRGTTIKGFNWHSLGLRNPFNHRERRRQRIEQAKQLRERGELQKPVPVRDRPRHVSARALEPVHMPTPLLDPELDRIIGEARAATERRQELERRAREARSGQVVGHDGAPERPPPE